MYFLRIIKKQRLIFVFTLHLFVLEKYKTYVVYVRKQLLQNSEKLRINMKWQYIFILEFFHSGAGCPMKQDSSIHISKMWSAIFGL